MLTGHGAGGVVMSMVDDVGDSDGLA
ncbi:hypothetical protein M3J09_004136 [Ascochyta lentis]